MRILLIGVLDFADMRSYMSLQLSAGNAYVSLGRFLMGGPSQHCQNGIIAHSGQCLPLPFTASWIGLVDGSPVSAAPEWPAFVRYMLAGFKRVYESNCLYCAMRMSSDVNRVPSSNGFWKRGHS
jgi:hypothetical protein